MARDQPDNREGIERGGDGVLIYVCFLPVSLARFFRVTAADRSVLGRWDQGGREVQPDKRIKQ